jgi:hypothetical protein
MTTPPTIEYYAIVIEKSSECCQDFINSTLFETYFQDIETCFPKDEHENSSTKSTNSVKCTNSSGNTASSVNTTNTASSGVSSIHSQNSATTIAIKLTHQNDKNKCQAQEELKSRINLQWKLVLLLTENNNGIEKCIENQTKNKPIFQKKENTVPKDKNFFNSKVLIGSCILENDPKKYSEDEQRQITSDKVHKLKYEIHEVCVNANFQCMGVCSVLMNEAVSVIKKNVETSKNFFTIFCKNINNAACSCYRKIKDIVDVEVLTELNYCKVVENHKMKITRFIYELKQELKLKGGNKISKNHFKMHINTKTKSVTFSSYKKDPIKYDFSNTTIYQVYRKFIVSMIGQKLERIKITFHKDVPVFPKSFKKFNEKHNIAMVGAKFI